jgi:hypothetical protein
MLAAMLAACWLLLRAVCCRFSEGDCVRVKPEEAAIRWRRPHLRTPGYIFGQVSKHRSCHHTAAAPVIQQTENPYKQTASEQKSSKQQLQETHGLLSVCQNAWHSYPCTRWPCVPPLPCSCCYAPAAAATCQVGVIERPCVGLFGNPELKAFREDGPRQPLYR